MTQHATEDIEVEVVEIDGVAPVPTHPEESSPDPSPARRGLQDWRQWQGRVKHLDARWWPLWTLLGIIALSLLLTVGLVIGFAYLIFRAISAILRALFD